MAYPSLLSPLNHDIYRFHVLLDLLALAPDERVVGVPIKWSDSPPAKKPRVPYTVFHRSPQSVLKSKMAKLTPTPSKGAKAAATVSSPAVIEEDPLHGPQPARKSAKGAKGASAGKASKALAKDNSAIALAALPTPPEPTVLIPNLYDPALAPPDYSIEQRTATYKVVPAQPRSTAASDTRQLQSTDSNGTVVPFSGPFTFFMEPSALLRKRIKDLEKEREKLRRARELVKQRTMELEEARKQAAEELTRRGTAIPTKAYITLGVQTDGGSAEGKEMYATRWSSSGPGMAPKKPIAAAPGLAPATSNDRTLDPKSPGAKAPPRKGKKKRSAHANANNVHHRDNYIPSRAPRTTAASAAAMAGPASFAEFPSLGLVEAGNPFSTASYHPQTGLSNLVPFFASPDEWLCSWCEFDLMFGDSAQLAKSIKKRKSVLKIRKRAQKRAARAASGVAPPTKSEAAKAKAAKLKAAATANAPPAAPATRKNGVAQTVADGVDPHAPKPVKPVAQAPAQPAQPNGVAPAQTPAATPAPATPAKVSASAPLKAVPNGIAPSSPALQKTARMPTAPGQTPTKVGKK